MKKLYEFEVKKKVTIDEGETTKNDKGESVTITRKVEKEVPHKFFIRKPTRAMYDDAELFFAIELSDSIKRGLLTRAQLETKFANEGETLSNQDKEDYIAIVRALLDKEKKIQEFAVKADTDPEEKEALQKVSEEVIDLRRQLHKLESSQASLYDHTAETRARNRTILWWMFQLAYKDPEAPFFSAGDFKQQLLNYDKLLDEEEDEFQIRVAGTFLYLISAWNLHGIVNKEGFDKVAELIGLIEPVKTAEKELAVA